MPSAPSRDCRRRPRLLAVIALLAGGVIAGCISAAIGIDLLTDGDHLEGVVWLIIGSIDLTALTWLGIGALRQTGQPKC